LHKAALRGHMKVTQLLVNAGASLDLTDSEVELLIYQLVVPLLFDAVCNVC